jgi:hypothetical protein
MSGGREEVVALDNRGAVTLKDHLAFYGNKVRIEA